MPVPVMMTATDLLRRWRGAGRVPDGLRRLRASAAAEPDRTDFKAKKPANMLQVEQAKTVPKIPLAKDVHFVILCHVNSVLEIEMALLQLPPQERWEIARWLLADLEEGALGQAEGKASGDDGGQTPLLPDYSGRRRRIFGNKVLPNMVQLARAEERW
jgi:hypothetical protein